MIYSRTSEYALRALTHFADRTDPGPVTVAEAAEASGVPRAYVAKIFQCLARNGILVPHRGAAGGYSLAVPARRLTLLRVIRAVDDLSASSFSNCVMGLDRCEDDRPCPLHPVWKKAKERMLAKLEATTVADLAALGDKFRPGPRRRSVLSRGMRDVFSL